MASATTAVRVDPSDPTLRSVCEHAATAAGVPSRDLQIQLLLHLPRLAAADAMATIEATTDEAARLATKLALSCEAVGPLLDAPAHPSSTDDLVLCDAAESTARLILENCHYLHSFRSSSQHFGGELRDRPGRPAALLSVSPLDVPWLADALPETVAASQTAVLSRVFAFDWAPPNCLSFLMGQLAHRLHTDRPELRLLLTYLNPNLGFTGASYRAANWLPAGEETGTRYAYLGADYVTDRALADRFGTADPAVLADTGASDVTFSAMPLRPLELFAYPLDPALRQRLASRPPAVVRRGAS